MCFDASFITPVGGAATGRTVRARQAGAP